MNNRYLLLFFVLLFHAGLFAQTASDDCANPTVLPDQIEYCSAIGEWSNAGASRSFEDSNDYPVCFDEREDVADVWFSFVARRNSVNIILTGATPQDPGGTIEAPQFALYPDQCTGLEDRDNQLGCRSPAVDPNTNLIQNGGNIIFTGLTLGETYKIMVAGRFGNTGTFQLCVNQFEQTAAPSGDCGTGVILCDKSPFAVQSLTGRGEVADDLLPSPESCSRPADEQNSSWYQWTCEQSGNLTFTITPLGLAFNEDIDFVLYELPDGLGNCGNRNRLREMYSGETGGLPPDQNLPCLGPTGMSAADNDVVESCGCSPGNNNFVRDIDMVAGRSYALVIMNFSGSGDGFSIEFGGSGTFVGPEAQFTSTSSEVCVGEALVFEDQSTSLDAIISREWDFGRTATPRFASGPGPHSVVFGEPGNPNVQLVIETERDCREIANAQDVNVICCEGQFTLDGTASALTCPNDSSGTIDLVASSDFSPTTLTFAWNTGDDTEDLDGLPTGTYTVTISDESGCTDSLDFVIDGPPAFTFDTLITMPTCGGQADGSFEFTVTGGGTMPYEYSLDGAPFGDDNRLDDIPVSTVNVRVRDGNDCLVEQDIEVTELELGLVQGFQAATEPVCAGDNNGTLTIEIANGRPAYTYDFGLGDGFQAGNTRAGLGAGTYTVTARDADGCLGFFDLEITEPPILNFSANGTDLTCFGDDDGRIDTLASGGRPDYTVTFQDGTAFDTLSARDLPPGTYSLQLTDGNGCTVTDQVTLTEPNQIFPEIVAVNNLPCFGVPTGSIALTASGGTPGYTYSADNVTFQNDTLLGNLLAGDYTLYVMDANGCTDSIPASLTEPREFIIDPGRDGVIQLGFDTILRATSNYLPVSYSWGPDSLLCLDPLCTRVRAQPFLTTDYQVVGTNDQGCTDTAFLTLTVIDDKPLYIPNAFSPNEDGANDGFTVYGGRAVARVESLRVYHRWGGLVFERDNFPANEPSLGWNGTVDGREANAAVFVYYAAVRFVNGDLVEFTGDVTLLR